MAKSYASDRDAVSFLITRNTYLICVWNHHRPDRPNFDLNLILILKQILVRRTMKPQTSLPSVTSLEQRVQNSAYIHGFDGDNEWTFPHARAAFKYIMSGTIVNTYNQA